MPSNIFDWKGPEFLALYGALMIACVVVGLILRWLCRFPLSHPPESPMLDSYQTAYLAGGYKRVTETAIARLMSMNVISVKMSPKGAAHLSLETGSFSPAHPTEEAVISSALKEASIMNARVKVERESSEIRDRLSQLGLVPSQLGSLMSRVGGILLSVLLVIGMTKGLVGLVRDKPVQILAVALVLTCVLIFWLGRASLRSGRGDRVLQLLKRDSAALEHYVRHHFQKADALDLGYAVALFGAGCLSSSIYPELKNALTAKEITGSSINGCGSGCGGGGCGGGCGGCGG